VVPFRVDEVTPADMVDRSPQDPQMTAKYDSWWRYNLSRTITPPSTFQDYVRTLPTYGQRFFAWGRPYGKLEWADIVLKINTAITDKERLDLAPDGGLTDKGGSFGMVCAKGEEELWEMAGPPVDGDTTTANSKRAELTGYAASLKFLLMAIQWVDVSGDRMLHTQTWIDSSGAGRHLSNLFEKNESSAPILTTRISSHTFGGSGLNYLGFITKIVGYAATKTAFVVTRNFQEMLSLTFLLTS
jgi:hypothetical protein